MERGVPDNESRRAAVNLMVRRRADRKRFFPEIIFTEPAWDILLSLYAAAIESRGEQIDRLGQEAAVAPSVVERWARTLEAEGFVQFERSSDPGRSGQVSLTEKGWHAMDSYFEGLSSKDCSGEPHESQGGSG